MVKLLPVIVTTVFALIMPLDGEIDDIFGDAVPEIEKLVELCPVAINPEPLETLTVIGAVIAPLGTVVVQEVDPVQLIFDGIPPPFAARNDAVVTIWMSCRFVPVIVTGVPTGPATGEMLEITGRGGGSTTKLVELVRIPLPALIEMGPVTAPCGT